jgi:FtsP/CotA-like multicopper oxidase with cupredoxin domain
MKRRTYALMGLALALIILGLGITSSQAASTQDKNQIAAAQNTPQKITPAERRAAALRFKKMYAARFAQTDQLPPPVLDPTGVPHYFGPWANYANSPMPKGSVSSIVVNNGGSGYTAPVVTIEDYYGTGHGATATASIDATGVIRGIVVTSPGTGYTAPVVFIEDATGVDADATALIGGILSGGIRKFIDRLPGLGSGNANLLGQYIPVAVPNTSAYTNSDYYQLEVGDYFEKLHSDLPPTKLRGYRQVGSPYHYLGPLIIAQKDRAVRVKFTNSIATGSAGDIFLPVDTTLMGAGMGPVMGESYTQNRAVIHLHGGVTPWISDGTPHQWITPAGESTSYPKGVSMVNVPDMPDPGAGSQTYYFNNQQSSRLMFYHDHALGTTRLNVYAGQVAGYLVTDDVESDLINGTNGTGVNPDGLALLPDLGIPLIIQDKTFVDESTIASQDPTWKWGSTPPIPHTGDLWMPHVYMTNQNPSDPAGMNAFGRWHYGPWFWPPTSGITHGPVPNPYFGDNAWEAELNPGTPHPAMAMEAYMDTPLINGTLYPYLEVEPKAYRFRILNGANDRFFNLQMYVADPAVVTSDGRLNTEVKMVPAVATAGFPAKWPTDGREGGVPDALTAGPSWIQIGTEGGFLPAPVVIPNQPVTWNLNQTTFNFGNVQDHSLLLGCAERADVIVDFSAFAGQTIILYNDAPAAFPALDPRYDYYTGSLDQVFGGGTPPTQAGFGPNTRTIMQIRVAGTPAAAYPLNALKNAFAKTASKNGVFEQSHPPIIVPEARYNSAYNGSFPADPYVRINHGSKTFQTLAGNTVTIPFKPKAIQDEMGEAFDPDYGRMSGFLGVELPVGSGVQRFTLFPYLSPPTDVMETSMTPMAPVAGDGTQIWKITHNGVDTHPIHFHLFNVQLINHVAWDNAVRPPDANELGWKETVRIDPLEDTIVAMRPVAPTQPFEVPNSIRPIDPTKEIGVTLQGGPGGFKNPAGDPVTVVNHLVNFGWEYVWHCHILGHEEMDMMHGLPFATPPTAPSDLVAAQLSGPVRASLTWTDNSGNETGFTIERATDNLFTAGLTSFTTLANVASYTDPTIVDGTVYFYRVMANNVVGDSETPGFPTISANSAYSNTAQLGTLAVPGAPTTLVATAFSATRVDLTWVLPAGTITGFRVERSIDGGSTWPVNFLIVNPTAIAYSDNTALPATAYSYRVFAYNASGDSLPSNIATATTPAGVPNAPTGFTAVAFSSTQVNTAWSLPVGGTAQTGFRVERSTDSGATWPVSFAIANPAAVSYSDVTAAPLTTYMYRVIATNSAGDSPPSNTATVTTPGALINAPSNLAGTLREAGTRVRLTWNDNSNNETGFYIERRTTTGTWARIGTVKANIRTFLDTKPPRRTTLLYRVIAYRTGLGVSLPSNEFTITTR